VLALNPSFGGWGGYFIFHIFFCSLINNNTTTPTFSAHTSKLQTLALFLPSGEVRRGFFFRGGLNAVF
jgi:hypothetical protein